MTTEKIILRKYNWQVPAVASLISAIIGSIYTTTKDYSPCSARLIYLISLLAGGWSVFKQIQSARAKIVEFNEDSWQSDGNHLFLTIESNFVLFRFELRKENGTYQEVGGDTETSADGKTTKVIVNSNLEGICLRGRIIIR